MVRPSYARCLIAGGLSLASAQAFAGPAECEALQNAFNAVAAVPAYRQVVDMPTTKMRFEAVVIGEMIYSNVEGKWTKIRLKPGGRKGILDQVMSMSALLDCTSLRNEEIPAGRSKVYQYTMTPPKGMPGATGPVQTTIWIGLNDGLVHRMTTSDMKVEITYDKVMPPIP